MSRRRKRDGRVSKKDAKTVIKAAAVLARDYSPLTADEAMLTFAYCWRNTQNRIDDPEPPR